MNNITSVTVVLEDNTIWSAPGSAFIQVTPPAETSAPTEEQVKEAVDTAVEGAFTPQTNA